MKQTTQQLFMLGPQKDWTTIDLEAVLAKRLLLRRQLVDAQTEEVGGYHERQPEATADADIILAWEEEGRELCSKHERELKSFDEAWDIEPQIETLASLYAEYGKRHEELAAAMSEAEATASEQIVPLESERARLEGLKTQIETEQTAIAEILHKLGVQPTDYVFTGWEGDVQRGLFVEACQARGIDPVKAPVVPEMPASPLPIEPQTDRKLEDKSPVWKNIALLIGGLALGSAAGAATGGITFDSDGWHFNVIFWIMLTVGTVMTYMVGKHIFPRLLAIRMIDAIDVYPYLPDEIAATKRARASLLAGVALVGIFLAFATIDFYGWWRAATERNAAFCGDEGAILINPYFAGIAVMFLTCFMAGVKLASISSAANAIRNKLLDEAVRNEVVYADLVKKHEYDQTEYDEKAKESREYRELLGKAHANVAFRFRREMGSLAERIKAYRESVIANAYDPNRFAEIEAEEARVAENALDAIQDRFDSVADVEVKIEAVHDKVDELLSMETPPREVVVDELGFLNRLFSADGVPKEGEAVPEHEVEAHPEHEE